MHLVVINESVLYYKSVRSLRLQIPSDLYSPVLGMSPAIDKLFEKLNKRLKFELKVQERYMKLQGAMQCFFTATGLS